MQINLIKFIKPINRFLIINDKKFYFFEFDNHAKP